MAAPIKQPIKINFSGGLDLKTDDKQTLPSEFLALDNMVFTVGGELTKRNGFLSFGKSVNTPNPALTYSFVPSTIVAGRKAFSFQDELLINDGFNLYSYDDSASAWNYKGRQTIVGLSTSNIAQGKSTYTVAGCSIDTTTGIKVFAYYGGTGSNSVFYSIQDIETGQFLVNQALFGTGYILPKCISIAGKSWITAVNVLSGHIDYQAIVGQTVTGGLTALITNLNSSQYYDIDVDVFSGNIYIAYLNSSGTPAVTISALSTSLVVGNTITKNATASHGVSWFGDGSNIWVIYNDGTNTKAFIVNNAVSATVAAPTTIDNSDSTNVNNLTGCWSTVLNKAFIFYDPLTLTGGLTATAAIYFSSATLSGSTITPSSPGLFMGSVTLNSKAFAVSGIPHVVGLYNYFSTITSIENGAAVTTNQVPQATNFLLNLYNVTPTMGAASNNDVIANIAAKISPGEAAIVPPQGAVGGLSGASSGLSSVHQNSSGAWELALLQNSNFAFEAANPYFPFYAPTGVIDCQFDFSLANPDGQSLGNNAQFAGGHVTMYDGANVVEQNFHIYPNSSTAVVSTAMGGVLGLGSANSLYSYIYTYEWIDNQGQVHRSFPSPVVTALDSGHLYSFSSGTVTGVVTLTIPTLRVTNKGGSQVVINIYRTIANGSIYFLLGSYGTKLNDPAADTVTYVDQGTADSAIIGNLQLYTTGALGYFAPPAAATLNNFKNRALSVGSEDPYQLGYSNAVLQNFPVQFVPEFLQNIGTVGGPIVAVAQMDDKMIFFKSGKEGTPAIHYMAGQGPAPSGAGNDFQDPLPIATDTGCVDRPSVVLTPMGLMYKSDKGIYLLDRSLQVDYIGAPVELYNQYSILSSILVPNTTQVRYSLSNGTMLMYDYFYKKWATFSNPAGVSDCIFQGQHTYIASNGTVYQETPGTYYDGTATPVLWSFQIAWIKLAGLQGYQRAYFLYILATYISSHKLTVNLYTDFSTTPDSTVTITPDFSKSLENWRVFFKKQRCQSFSIQIQEVSTGVLGAGCSVSGLNLIAGIKGPFRTISAAQSTG